MAASTLNRRNLERAVRRVSRSIPRIDADPGFYDAKKALRKEFRGAMVEITGDGVTAVAKGASYSVAL